MFLHLTCAFEVITLPNERVIALFHHFFVQFQLIVEIDQKAHNTTTSRPPVPCILQIWHPPLARYVSRTGLTIGRLSLSVELVSGELLQ